MSANYTQEAINVREFYNDLSCRPCSGFQSEVRVEDYGAVGNGVTDDSQAFSDAIAVADYIVLTNGRNYIVSGIRVLDHTVTWITNGAQINGSELSPVSVGPFLPENRGQVFIMNNPPPITQAGESAGLQIHIGDNPTATPGVENNKTAVAQTITINNLNGRGDIWGLNIVTTFDVTGTDGLGRGAEVEISSALGADSNPNPYSDTASPAFRKNGLEIVGQGGGDSRLTAAMMVYVNDPTGDLWWQEGIAISRAVTNGIHFYSDPVGVDAISAFANASILDDSNSTNVIKAAGSHSAVIDVAEGGFTHMIKTSDTVNQTLKIGSNGTAEVDLQVESGDGANVRDARMTFAHNGTVQWSIIKNAGNDFSFFNNITGNSVIFMDSDATNPVSLYVGAGSRRVQLGAPDSGGAGKTVLVVDNP